MKRVLMRIAALTAVVVVGLAAIAQAQRMLRERAAQAGALADAGDVAAAKSGLLENITGGEPNRALEEPGLLPHHDDLDESPWSRAPADANSAYDAASDPTTAYTERPIQRGDDARRRSADLPLLRGQPLTDAEEAPDDDEAFDAPPLSAPVRNSAAGVAATRYAEPARFEPGDDEPLDADELSDDDEPPRAAAPPVDEYDDYDDLEPADQQPRYPASVGRSSDDLGGYEDDNDAAPTASPPVSSRRALERRLDEPAALPQHDDHYPPPSADDVASPQSRAVLRDPAPAALPHSDEFGTLEGSGRPGQAELEGRQSHSLELEKHFPAEAQVGKPVAIEIALRNSGSAAARQLEIIDQIPQGTRLIATNPRAEMDAQGGVRWAIAGLRPGEETRVSMEVLPLVEGELGSVATVRYAAEASARSKVTRPVVELRLSGPRQVLIGEDAQFNVTVSNRGSGVARDVLLSDQLPEGLSHPSGAELEYEVGDLQPGESREVQLDLTAAKAGRFTHAIRATGDGDIRTEDISEIEIIAPQMELELIGGARRYLERPAKFTLSVANHGTAPARAVEIAAELPQALAFVEATHYGQYDERTHSVHWSLDELPAGQAGEVELTLRPTAEGEQTVVLRGSGLPMARVEKQHTISVEGIATTMFEVIDVEDPVERGEETSYEIRVVNQGTKATTNVQIVAVLPDGLEPTSAEGPTRYQIDGQRVLFDPLERLAAKADTSYRIRAKAVRTGEMRIQVQLLTDDLRSPLTKEESTRVYSNE